MEMEKVKDPAMLMACVSLMATMGGGGYFYKQLEAIRLEQERMNIHLNKLTERVTAIEVSNSGRQEMVADLNKQLKDFGQQITSMPRVENIPSYSDIDVLDRDLDELILDLQERSIEVNRASKESQSRRVNKRYGNHRESTDDLHLIQKGRLGGRPKSDERSSGRPYTEPKTPLYQSAHPNHYQPSYYQSPQPYQTPQPNYQAPPSQPTYQAPPSQPVYQSPPPPQTQPALQPQPFEDGDDLDLINHVRKQHG